MQHKSETQNMLQSLITFAHTQFHAFLKTIRVDNGAKFLSMQTFSHTHGIEFQHTCVYTPQQNGVVERKHHHILVVVRGYYSFNHAYLSPSGVNVFLLMSIS